MGKDVPFDPQARCDDCGALGAYDFYGDNACEACSSFAIEAHERSEKVCHADQLTIWSDEVVGALSMGGFIRDGMSYDDKVEIHRIVADEVKQIVASAFSHPELKPKS